MDTSDPLTALQAMNAAFTLYEKASKVYRDWIGSIPDTPTRDAMARDLKAAEDSMEIAKAQMAQSFGYPLCRKHFPPGIRLKLGEGVYHCEKCQDTTGQDRVPQRPHPENYI